MIGETTTTMVAPRQQQQLHPAMVAPRQQQQQQLHPAVNMTTMIRRDIMTTMIRRDIMTTMIVITAGQQQPQQQQATQPQQPQQQATQPQQPQQQETISLSVLKGR
jgi:hypothetical protein